MKYFCSAIAEECLVDLSEGVGIILVIRVVRCKIFGAIIFVPLLLSKSELRRKPSGLGRLGD